MATIALSHGPKRRPERPNLGELKSIRFVTENDYPPFNFLAADGTLVGFNVELARAVCVELKLTCTIQPRDWESLIPSLKSGEADAVIAGIAITARARREVDFSDRYLQNPARFVARNGAALDPSADLLAGNLSAWVDDQELTFQCDRRGFTILDHVRCDFRFKAPWTLQKGKVHSFRFREGNYDLDDVTVAQPQGGGLLPGGAEPHRLRQPDVAKPVGKQGHAAAVLHRLELFGVPGQDDLAATLLSQADQVGQVRAAHHRGLVYH